MGGYGALYAATRLGRDRVFGCVASSPAIWPTFDTIVPNAFDDRAQFDRDGIFTRLDGPSDVRLRVDCGNDDAFFDNVTDLRGRLKPEPAGGFSPGGHTEAYWTRMIPDQLRFLSDNLPA